MPVVTSSTLVFKTDNLDLNTLFLNKNRNITHNNIIVSLRLAIPKTPYIINSLSSNNWLPPSVVFYVLFLIHPATAIT